MSATEYAKGITAEDLRTLLAYWPQLMAEGESVAQETQDERDETLPVDPEYIGWCYLYELPIQDHLIHVTAFSVHNLGESLPLKQVETWFKQLKESRSQIGSTPDICTEIGEYFESQPVPNEVQMEKFRSIQSSLMGSAQSIFNTLRCILYHGCFLNELIERVRNGDDAALFAAIRMDTTVIGCPSVIQRISKATLFNEEKFFKKLRNAINGKQTKREQSNFQMMRLVLEILHETGAENLSDKQLHKLFIKELQLYSRDADPKALRKFANTYMAK